MSNRNKYKPEIVVFAGPNGSGKSTITTPEWIKGEYINADDIQRSYKISNMEAAERADQRRYELLAEKATFSFETVLSTARKLTFLKEAKETGYFIRGYFITTCDPMLNVSRVHARVLNGLHDVPKDKIISRYYRAMDNLPEFISICDICHVYDNTDEPFRICRKHKNSITWFPCEFWSDAALQKLLFGRRTAEMNDPDLT